MDFFKHHFRNYEILCPFITCHVGFRCNYTWNTWLNKYFTAFYTVPVDEFNKVKETCKASKNYKESNELTFSYYRIPRSDPMLVQVVEQLGLKANSRLAQLKVVEIPDAIEWSIEEYDGMESVHEAHRIWD